MTTRRAAIVLAGGRSRRMGVDKLALRLGESTLLERAVAACAAHADALVVAGPKPPQWQGPPGAIFVVEDPPFGGPAAGIAVALAHLARCQPHDPDAEVLLLAGDLENPDRVVEALMAAELGTDGVALRDIDGWVQYLAGRYRILQLRNVFISDIPIRDISVRRQMRGLSLKFVDSPRIVTRDIDTPSDAAIAGISSPPNADGR